MLSETYQAWLAANKLDDQQLAILIGAAQREIPIAPNSALRALFELVELRERVQQLEQVLDAASEGWGFTSEQPQPLSTDERTSAMELVYATTPGPWYAHATDDTLFMNARYVGTVPCEFRHDGLLGMDIEGGDEQAPFDQVIAITLLQAPRMACIDEHDENTLFIAQSRTLIPRYEATCRQLEARLTELQKQQSTQQ